MLLSKFSSDQPVEVDPPETMTAVEYQPEQSKLTPYPMPAQDYLIIPIIHSEWSKMEPINTRGQVISLLEGQMEVGDAEIKLDVSGVKAGFYFLRVSFTDRIESYKILVE